MSAAGQPPSHVGRVVPVLTHQVPGWVLAVAISGTSVIGAGAFWLSATALTNLAVRSGIASWQAWMWPVIVDGMIVIATVAIVALESHGPRAIAYPWLLLGTGTAVSVLANTVHAFVVENPRVPALVAAMVADVPPLVLLASTHLTVELVRRSRPFSPAVGSARARSVDGAAAAVMWTRPAAAAGSDEIAASGAGPTRSSASERTVRPSRQPSLAKGRGDDDGQRRDRAHALSGRGMSNAGIAAELGVHKSTVGRWLGSRPEDGPAARAGPKDEGDNDAAANTTR